MDNLDTAVKNLNARGFIARRFSTSAEARQAVMDVLGKGSVGVGGTKTVGDMGLFDAIRENGNELICHTFAPAAEKAAMRRRALDADAYLTSVNAITLDGQIVNIDGTGNRVAAMLFGPETVVAVAGRNKLADGYDAAVERIRTQCCPENARRLGLKTPCALTGKCTDCRMDERMCRAFVTLEFPTRNVKKFYVFLVDEDLGW